MATIPNSKLIVISSPYAKFGVLYEHHRDYYGTDDPDILVWSAPTTVMNPTIDQGFIDKESAKDPAAAASEWYAEFRQDVETFINREVLESVIVSGCYEIGPVQNTIYKAFCDPAGGSGRDSYALAIGHYNHKNKMRVLDLVRAVKPPFSPANITKEFSQVLKSYGVHEVTGDKWGGEFPREAFLKNGITYRVAEKAKSDLYRDLLPLINSGKVELLDNEVLTRQLLGLERKVARSGKDSIDHGPRGHDDCANAAAGCLTSLTAGSEVEIKTTLSKAIDYGHDIYRDC
jgi:hypothetical protein